MIKKQEHVPDVGAALLHPRLLSAPAHLMSDREVGGRGGGLRVSDREIWQVPSKRNSGRGNDLDLEKQCRS